MTKKVYKTNVSLSFYTEVNDRTDTNWSMSFDASDTTVDTVLAKVQIMLHALGYITDGQVVRLVSDYGSDD
jgi:hypothetical protein